MTNNESYSVKFYTITNRSISKPFKLKTNKNISKFSAILTLNKVPSRRAIMFDENQLEFYAGVTYSNRVQLSGFFTTHHLVAINKDTKTEKTV